MFYSKGYFLPPRHKCPRTFMLMILMGKKKHYWKKDVSFATTLTTPEFDKKVLWSKVKNNQRFLLYIPDNLIAKPERLPKEWLWRVICKFDPEFAEKYAKRALQIDAAKRLPKTKQIIKIAPEHLEVLKFLNIQPH